jgi:hypothetical protein
MRKQIIWIFGLMVSMLPIVIDYNLQTMRVRDWVSLVAIELIVQYKKEIVRYL